MGISFQVLKDRNSALLVYGQLISQSCDKMMTVGLIWVLTRQASATAIPLFLGISALPHLLMARHAGPLTIKWGALSTVIRTDFFRAILFTGLYFFWPVFASDRQLLVLFFVSFISNSAGALFNPAVLTLPVFMPEQKYRQQLTALIDTCFSLGNVAGPLLSAVFYPLLGLKGLFLFNGLSYFLATFLESKVKLSASPSAESTFSPEPEKSKSVFKILKTDSVLALMLGAFLVSNLALAPLMVFLPLFVKEVYHGDIKALVSLETLLAVGTVAGGLTLSFINLDKRKGKIVAGMLMVGACYVGFTLTREVRAGSLWLAALGFSLALLNIFSLGIFQSRPRSQDVPNVMSLVNLISTASLPFSMAILSLFLGRFDITHLSLTFGCILVAISMAVVSNAELRSL